MHVGLFNFQENIPEKYGFNLNLKRHKYRNYTIVAKGEKQSSYYFVNLWCKIFSGNSFRVNCDYEDILRFADKSM